MSATTEKVLELFSSRLTELDQEKGRIENAIAALGSTNGSVPAPARRRGRPRKRQAGGRAKQALAMIAAKPGITASEIARGMKIKPNYLYRVLSDLEKSKKVKKKGRTYSAV